MNKLQSRIFSRKNIPLYIMILIGSTGGFLYWKFIGCQSGTCKIKSVWYWSTLYGAIFGYLIGDIILGLLRKRRSDGEDLTAQN